VRNKTVAWVAAALLSGIVVSAAGRDDRRSEESGGNAQIEAFNASLLAAHLKMDTPAIAELWADDGVSLLPEAAPIVGKPAIKSFLAGVTEQLKGWRMEKMELDFHDIEVSGDWASEWAFEHQVVKPPDDSKPAFDGRGKMLLVLHRDEAGNWKIKREMWNQGAKP
jgi:ketosteroid isomerase-like protein